MSPSTSSVRWPASAKDIARLAETSDFPSPTPGLDTVSWMGRAPLVACFTLRRNERNASTTCAASSDRWPFRDRWIVGT
jgi:hypothetical protein